MPKPHLIAYACALALSAALLTPYAGSAREPDAVTVVEVLDLPVGERAIARGVDLVGDTDDGTVAASFEVDPGSLETPVRESSLIATNGSRTPAGMTVRAAAGDHLLGEANNSLHHRLSDGDWTPVTLPVGYTFKAATLEGIVLVAAGSTTPQLALLPWGSETTVTLPVPEGWTLEKGYSTGLADDHAVLLGVRQTGGFVLHMLYVDTAAMVSTVLAAAAPCTTTGFRAWAVNEGRIAWIGNSVICSAPAPIPGSELIVSIRPLPAYQPVPGAGVTPALLPVGDDVVVWRSPNSFPAQSTVPSPVYVVAADGTTRTATAWGHDVTASSPGHVLVAGGPDIAGHAIRRIEAASGDEELVTDVPGVPAKVRTIAVDDSRVVYADDSTTTGALYENSFTGEGFGEQAALDSDTGAYWPGAGLVAREGSTAWPEKTTWEFQDSSGTRRSGVASFEPTALSGSRLLLDNDALLDVVTGTIAPAELPARSHASDRRKRDLQDGVLYLPASQIPGADPKTVIARDLATREATSVASVGCEVGSVRVAGSWLAARCGTFGGYWWIVDLSGQHASWSMSTVEDLLLGNGFAVRQSHDDSVQWRDLAAGQDAPWQPLAPAGSVDSVSVSKGADPLVAWVSADQGKVARLPVVTSALPVHPQGIRPPSAPTADVFASDRSIRFDWDVAPAEEQVTGYMVTGAGPTKYFLPGASYPQVTNLLNGKTYNWTLHAMNIAGATGLSGESTPLYPTSPMTNVQAAVDPHTSKVTFTWDWTPPTTPAAATEPLAAFVIRYGPYLQIEVGPTARTASLLIPDAGSRSFGLYSRGPSQGTTIIGVGPLDFPGQDVTVPTARVNALPQVNFGTSQSLSVGATDNRKVAFVDVRMRVADFGKRLGAWSQPATLQRRQPGAIAISPPPAGGTRCYSVRSTDASGNQSAWTAPTCTSRVRDDTTLTRGGSWTTVRSSAYLGGSAARTTARGATLRGPVTYANGMWVVATTCPTCGSVQVLRGSTVVRQVSLRSSTTKHRQLLWIPWTSGGTLTLRSPNRNNKIYIDGVVARSY